MHCIAVAVIVLPHRPALYGDFRRQYGLSHEDVSQLDAVEFSYLVAGLEEGRLSHALQTSPPSMAPPPSATVSDDPAAYLRRVSKLRGHIVKQGQAK